MSARVRTAIAAPSAPCPRRDSAAAAMVIEHPARTAIAVLTPEGAGRRCPSAIAMTARTATTTTTSAAKTALKRRAMPTRAPATTDQLSDVVRSTIAIAMATNVAPQSSELKRLPSRFGSDATTTYDSVAVTATCVQPIVRPMVATPNAAIAVKAEVARGIAIAVGRCPIKNAENQYVAGGLLSQTSI